MLDFLFTLSLDGVLSASVFKYQVLSVEKDCISRIESIKITITMLKNVQVAHSKFFKQSVFDDTVFEHLTYSDSIQYLAWLTNLRSDSEALL